MLSLVPVVAGGVRLSGLAGAGPVTAENARFVAAPAPVVLHIVCASLFCVLGALQFDRSLRQRFPRWHRIVGTVAVPCGIVAGLTGLWMTAVYAIPAELQGQLLYRVRIVVGLAMALAVILSVRAVLQRRFSQHKAWMVRAYALGQGAGTQALVMLPVTLMAGAPTFVFRDVLMVCAWGLNVAFAEWIIRRRPPST
jgi:small-conductance mechanosensitive channel